MIWSLFSNSNNTVALSDVANQGHNYRIVNHLFPLPLTELRLWTIGDGDIALQLAAAEDRFGALWLQGQPLSVAAAEVVTAGKSAYRCFYECMNQLRLEKLKIECWDSGWWQVRSALTDRSHCTEQLLALKAAHDALRAKLLPAIPELGFLR